ncbi:hypothetical protein ODJ79_09900 [Actinoplanes sp. KI2]|uniref:hypothetical protein n=1 Tax=Actinoplanes sp. KI2 TaxID=2983315 RepID=UPI0021D57623|nr:hypothetical protein [Actinoplanes sp. KI2]MCU7724027.1 hypothetical protein [Actinoplanes sp. KI2]
MKYARAALTLAAAASALVVGLQSPAMASDSYHEMHTGDAFGGSVFGYYGTATFTEHGDVVTICDADADGHGVKMYVSLDDAYGPTQYTFHVGGKGNCSTHRASEGGAYDLPEKRYIGFLFCMYDGPGEEGECKAYKFYNDN